MTVETQTTLELPKLVTRNCIIRDIKLADAPALVRGLNQEVITRDTMIQQPWDIDLAHWWIGHIHKALFRNPPSEVHFAIEVDKELVGSIAVMNIQGHKAEIGYWLQEKCHRRGIMTQALLHVLGFCDETLGLKRIFAPVLVHNMASYMLLEKLGFRRESVLERYYVKDGQLCDAYGYVK